MGILSILKQRITHHPEVFFDSVFGDMELSGPGLWQTVQPIPLLPGMEPVTVTVESAGTPDHPPDATSHDTFEELCRRYEGLKASIAPVLCKAAPRIRTKNLWEHAWLASIEIWREPGTNKPVLALEYQLDDDPEYAYVVRVEDWRAVDILVTG